MHAATIASASIPQPRSGHPLWHLLVLAGAAVGLFIGIKAKEYRDARRLQRAPRSGRVHPTTSTSVSAPNLTLPVLALALLSIASATIHASVSREHFHEAVVFGTFFVAASTAQVGWAVLALHRPTTTLLIVGASGNATVVALWAMTRTIGLPIGPEPWHPESIGAADLISTTCELLLVIGALTLLTRHRHTRKRPTPTHDGASYIVHCTK